MKWIVFVMFVINVSYLGWQYNREIPAPAKPTAELPIPGGVNRLLLLSEVDRSTLRERFVVDEKPLRAEQKEQTTDSVEPVESGVPEGVCFSVGPLTSAEEVERIGVWLRSRGGSSVLRVGESREVSMYWVYFPPFPSRDEAEVRVKEMLNEGLDDIYIIPRGDQANAISLGVYSRKDSLNRRVEELKERGYDPSLVPRYRTQKASWFDVEFEARFEFPSERFAEIFPDTDATPTVCT